MALRLKKILKEVEDHDKMAAWKAVDILQPQGTGEHQSTSSEVEDCT